MTAQRWWVRVYARWIARVQAVQGQLNLFFTALSGTSLASGALKYFGAPSWLIAAFLVALAGLIVAYVYLYSEGGVWNQKERDQKDLSTNYIGPGKAMDMLLQGRQRAVLAQAIDEEWGDGRIRQEMDRETLALLRDYRDGIDVDDVLDNRSESATAKPENVQTGSGHDRFAYTER